MRTSLSVSILAVLASATCSAVRVSSAQESARGSEIRISRAAGPISVDGSLSDPGWSGATRVESWFEIRPGDNVQPKVKTIGYLTYDDRYFYAGFEFSDPEPSRIRAPYSDRDDISESIDYGGVILDTRNDGRTGILFLATPRGIQYDAVQDDASGNENSSPDFYWDSAGRITPDGWVLEIRIPFSSLRYSGGSVQTWGVMLFRNYPREFRYEFFSTRLPRGGSCFICRENTLSGLEGLPTGDHFVVAPYLSSREEGSPRDGPGSPLVNDSAEVTGGLDAKWIPNPDSALDLTVNPDFSQVESDVAKISANERFALFYPEKRPFFLEGMELFSTPVQAVYTRALTSPRWGLRATGKSGNTAYTALVGDDRGGGSVILPGPDGSLFADQDFASRVAVGRVRHDLGSSFVSFLVADREIVGGGSNRVFGPDFQWRPNDTDTVTGQLLFSLTETPDRPGLAAEWDGRKLAGSGADFWWSHSTRSFDASAEVKSFEAGFRADAGFVPQVGFREAYSEVGYTWHPSGVLSRIRAFAFTDPMWDDDGGRIRNLLAAGVQVEGRWNSVARVWVYDDRWRVASGGTEVGTFREIPKRQLRFILQTNPSMLISQVYLEGALGEEIDFDNARPGHGATLTLGTTFRPTDHLALRVDTSRRWIDVRPTGGGSEGRLFTAQVERLKATYTLNARSYLRLIGQYDRTDRSTALYQVPVDRRSGSFAGSALVAYKLNWQSVLFLGYGDDRVLDEGGGLDRTSRQFFLKISYAFQR
ncbi:MAG TPA: DUF5916 domain-containing protein [Thermoanaerobaculaceae bacterium]|nr:DUF5916 domain-containing protein [Thermoanaerobaculaceae bacterium]